MSLKRIEETIAENQWLHVRAPLSELEPVVTALMTTHARFAAGQIKPVEHGRLRAEHLGAAVATVAATLGVKLRQPLLIDSRGEFHLKAEPTEPVPGLPDICGHFGEEFAVLLNRHQARCGLVGGHMTPEGGWCYVNHFAAEALVIEYAEQVLSADKIASIRQFIDRTVRPMANEGDVIGEAAAPASIERER